MGSRVLAVLIAVAVLIATPSITSAAQVECLAEFQGPQPNYPAPPKTPKIVRCVDGDPICDEDGLPNGVCQFDVSVCLNVAQASCSSPGVASYVIKNKPLGHKKHNQDLQALQNAVDALGLPQTASVCTAPVPIMVPLKGPTRKGFFRRGKSVRLKGYAFGTDDSLDKEKLKLKCVPAPLPEGCEERSVKDLIKAAAENPVAAATFQKSWILASELGYDPALNSVMSCDPGADIQLYTGVLTGPEGPALLSLILIPGAQGAWAPLAISPGPNALKLFDSSGGILVEGLDTVTPTISLLDSDGNVVTVTVSRGRHSNYTGPSLPASATTGPICSGELPACNDYFWECGDLRQILLSGGKDLADTTARSIRDAAACVALLLLGPEAALACEVASGIKTDADLTKLLSELLVDLTGLRSCTEQVLNGNFLCSDFPANPCTFAGTCTRVAATTLECRPFGDWCTRCFNTRTSCTVDEFGNAECGPPFCGDGQWTPPGKDKILGTADDEECEIIAGAELGCPGRCVPPGLPNECKCGVFCGDGAWTPRGADGIAGTPDDEECEIIGQFTARCPGQCIPAGQPRECKCAVCGDNIREGPEQCDGTDDAACPGRCLLPGHQNECSCTPSCHSPCLEGEAMDPTTCAMSGFWCVADVCDNLPECCASYWGSACTDEAWFYCPVECCGDDVVNAHREECDGTDDDACPGLCNPLSVPWDRADLLCRCAYCGDAYINQPTEECDSTDDDPCPPEDCLGSDFGELKECTCCPQNLVGAWSGTLWGKTWAGFWLREEEGPPGLKGVITVGGLPTTGRKCCQSCASCVQQSDCPGYICVNGLDDDGFRQLLAPATGCGDSFELPTGSTVITGDCLAGPDISLPACGSCFGLGSPTLRGCRWDNPPPGCAASSSPGCGGCPCEEQVCSAPFKGYCCSSHWSAECAYDCFRYAGDYCFP